jgi:hypothetical protein
MGMSVALTYALDHWIQEVILLILLTCAYAVLQRRAIKRAGPRDATGNGIAIGRAKAFDNRSLQLRIDRLSDSLKELKVISQKPQEGTSYQEHSSSSTVRELTIGVKASSGGEKEQKKESTKHEGGEKNIVAAAPSKEKSAKEEGGPVLGLSAGDILSDQINLASQIANLEMLFERSLTDRLIDGRPRIQTVLGFQISINPPAGFENCVAVVEVGVRAQVSAESVSLVALIPQEKTYNAQTLRSSERSVGGSAVAKILTLGFLGKNGSRQLFVHRDSDTIAFERDPESQPSIFEDHSSSLIFGWEFRPVLGRRSVSAGTRQMLAVIALPKQDDATIADSSTLEIRTRTYWRVYKRRQLTTRRRWRWLPMKVDGSNLMSSGLQELRVPNSADVQQSLAPRIDEIKWARSGEDRVTVMVSGENFFSGTKVLMGGATYRDEDGSLTLKSDQAFEFHTPISSLLTGDAVLSGRFGSSFKLEMPVAKRPLGLILDGATLARGVDEKRYRIGIVIKAVDNNDNFVDLTRQALGALPDATLFVGSELVPLPYDFEELSFSTPTGSNDSQQLAHTAPEMRAQIGSASTLPKSSKEYSCLRLSAWIPAKTFVRDPLVTFRLPFCGADCHGSLPLSPSDPTITRIGGSDTNAVFLIARPGGFAGHVSVELDQLYVEGCQQLSRRNTDECRFEVPKSVVSMYDSLILQIEPQQPPPPKPQYPKMSYLLAIPKEAKRDLQPVIDDRAEVPKIAVGDLGPVGWSGTDLDAITDVTLFAGAAAARSATTATPSSTQGIPAEFSIYDSGKKIEVYFSEGSTTKIGKAEIEFKTESGSTIRSAIYIAKASAG